MLCSVVELYLHGKRRERSEAVIAYATSGDLIVTRWRGEIEGKAGVRVATLSGQNVVGNRVLSLLPLFEPQLLSMTRTGFVLRGWQVVEKDDRRDTPRHEEIQEWWVRPTQR